MRHVLKRSGFSLFCLSFISVLFVPLTYADLVPVHAYVNTTNGDHFYTINRNDSGLASYGYDYHGMQFYAESEPVPGVQPFYVYWNAESGDHFYMTNNVPGFWGYVNEGVAFYVYPDDSGERIPLWEYWNGDPNVMDHLYTTYKNDTWYAAFGFEPSRMELTIANVRGCIPPYSPGFWNNNSTTRINNNCYNYANNKLTNTFAQPGRASGDYCTQASCITCSEIERRALADGLQKWQSAWDDLLDLKAKLALVVARGYDYHWYRKDSNGTWTHKPGQTNATNLDNSGHVIMNPETADRGGYTDFCGYFMADSHPEQGQGWENIQ